MCRTDLAVIVRALNRFETHPFVSQQVSMAELCLIKVSNSGKCRPIGASFIEGPSWRCG